MRTILKITGLALSLSLASTANATVGISLSAETLADASGNALPQNALVILVASTSDTAFTPLSAGTSISVGGFLGGTDDKVLWKGDLTTNGLNGVLSELATVDFTKVGDSLALLWFPTHSLSSLTLSAGDSYGIFSSTNVATSGGDVWKMQGDGTNFNLNLLTLNASVLNTGGDLANSVGFASSVVIPETSTYAAILGALTLGVVAVRRYRKSAA